MSPTLSTRNTGRPRSSIGPQWPTMGPPMRQLARSKVGPLPLMAVPSCLLASVGNSPGFGMRSNTRLVCSIRWVLPMLNS